MAFISQMALGWGKTGHQIINGNFEKFLPSSLQLLSGNTEYYVQHASDADNRKRADPSESPKHFIDIDYYPEFSAGTLQHGYDALCAEYGSSTVIDNGTLPWAIASSYDSLVVYMRNHDWGDADRIIADLGHYIGDAFQPLHCTENYDGASTGNKGIHSRFESSLLDDYQGSIVIAPRTVGMIDTTVLEFAFRVIGESNSQVAAIMDADTYASGIDPQHGSTYYSALWSKLATLMNEQLQGASEALASLVYSAWIDAGSPELTAIARTQVPSFFRVSQIYPNPFNPSAKVIVTIPTDNRSSSALISIYSPDGRLVARERRELSAGTNILPLNFADYASGIYLISLDITGSGQRQRATLKAVLLK